MNVTHGLALATALALATLACKDGASDGDGGSKDAAKADPAAEAIEKARSFSIAYFGAKSPTDRAFVEHLHPKLSDANSAVLFAALRDSYWATLGPLREPGEARDVKTQQAQAGPVVELVFDSTFEKGTTEVRMILARDGASGPWTIADLTVEDLSPREPATPAELDAPALAAVEAIPSGTEALASHFTPSVRESIVSASAAFSEAYGSASKPKVVENRAAGPVREVVIEATTAEGDTRVVVVTAMLGMGGWALVGMDMNRPSP
jgi:hypothetical protein